MIIAKLNPGLRNLLRNSVVLNGMRIDVRIRVLDSVSGSVSKLADMGVRATLVEECELTATVSIDELDRITDLSWVLRVHSDK